MPKPLLVLLCLVAMALNFWALERWNYSVFGGPQDYLGSYVGGSLVGTPDLYNRSAQLRVQEQVGLPQSTRFLWMRLPFYALLFKPFAWMPYVAGMVAWKLFSLVLVCAAIWATPAPKWMSVAALCVCLPLWVTFLLGNDGAVVLLAVALFARYVAVGKEAAAGLALGVIAAVKPQLVPFLFIVILVQRRWQLIQWACISAGPLLGLCFVLQGFGWPAQWLHFLSTASVNSNRLFMPNATGLYLFWDPVYASAVTCILAALWAAREARMRLTLPHSLLYAAVMFAAIVVSPHSYTYDYALPIPLLVAAWSQSPQVAKWIAVFTLPFIYLPVTFAQMVIGPAVVVFAVFTFLFFLRQDRYRVKLPDTTMLESGPEVTPIFMSHWTGSN